MKNENQETGGTPAVRASTGGTPVLPRRYWRSLDELAGTAEFKAVVEREFPNHASELLSSSRRGFLKIMGASVALAGMSGCLRWPEEHLAPYGHRPAGRMDGVPVHYATAFELCGVGQGLLVTSVDGRPIKIEGNPTHPLNMGATNTLAQASVLDVYDPSRSRGVMKKDGEKLGESSWAAFAQNVVNDKFVTGDGTGFVVLSEGTRSPSIMAMWGEFLVKYPKAKWVEFDPVSDDNQREGTRLAMGMPYKTVLDLSKAEVILSLDADLFGSTDAAGVKYAREFAMGRRVGKDAENEKAKMNRLYAVESIFSNTGSTADHRRAVKASAIGALAAGLMSMVGPGGAVGSVAGIDKEFIEALVADLAGHKGSSVVVAGERQSPEVHAAAAMINIALGNVGKTVTYYQDWDASVSMGTAALKDLVGAISGGAVTTLMIIGGNPVYNAPADLKFGEALKKVATKIRIGIYEDETSELCDWHISQTHYLEAWGDVRSIDGTVSIVQPMIEPLFGGKSVVEILGAFARGKPDLKGYDLVREVIGKLVGGISEYKWKNALVEGFIAGTEWKPVAAQPGNWRGGAAAAGSQKYEVVFFPDYKVFDGRFANNGWLQELPDPMSRMCWDNAGLVSWKTYEELTGGTTADEVVTIEANGAKMDAALCPIPGMPDGVVAIALGYGRTAAGHIGNKVGFNAYPLRTSAAMGFAPANVTKTGRTYELATVQAHFMIDWVGKRRQGKIVPELVKERTFANYKDDAAVGIERIIPLSLWNEKRFDGLNGKHTLGREAVADKDLPANIAPQNVHKWGMSIDLSVCTGCSACVVACQAENNIPIVGKEQVINGREMHWIRIDRYFRNRGEELNPAALQPADFVAVHQPVTCMHCENAPCEEVCPVAATTHSQEGVNMMTYNRCIGTRYCSNNCPYKVRRFNFFDYNSGNFNGNATTGINEYTPNLLRQNAGELMKMQKNPDVTVRFRGVMEKCTYCVQRIENTRITAKREGNREIKDGEIKTACQQVCPTQAIVFGDLYQDGRTANVGGADVKRTLSKVAELQSLKRSYGMLDPDLNTKPRTIYLAKLRNPSGTLDADLYKLEEEGAVEAGDAPATAPAKKE